MIAFVVVRQSSLITTRPLGSARLHALRRTVDHHTGHVHQVRYRNDLSTGGEAGFGNDYEVEFFDRSHAT